MYLEISIILFILFFIFIKKEQFQIPFWQTSPLKRNMPYDLRCEEEIPKKNFLWRNSSINFYDRPKCLKM